MSEQQDAYSAAGVNLAAAAAATAGMKEAIQATYGPEVLAGMGAFGGLYDAAALKMLNRPVIVASTDGVGTKTKVAATMGRWDTVGHDIVNHCVNDILVQGATPLFFLDYVASSRLEPIQISTIVNGIAAACQALGIPLLGGETAEMPGVYQEGELDIVGTVIGMVDQGSVIDGRDIQIGDQIIAFPSNGLHTNGYSLARKVLAGIDWHEGRPVGDLSVGEALLLPHQCYLAEIRALQAAGVMIKGLAHITGGGVIDNLPRILPAGTAADIHVGSCPVPPIFELIQSEGGISQADMFQTFNMGMGMLAVLSSDALEKAHEALPHAYLVGEIVAGAGKVRLAA